MNKTIQKEIKRALCVLTICLPIIVIMGSEWIVRTYGTLLVATASDSFLHFFENKRSLLVKEVFVPAFILYFILYLISMAVEKRKQVKPSCMKKVIIILLAAGMIFSCIRLDIGEYLLYNYRNSQPKWFDTQKVVVHALGEIDGYTYTNSKDALENSYKNGNRLFECDFMLTADEQLVACHDWEFWEEVTESEDGACAGEVPVLEEFLDREIYGQYAPLSGRDILSFMKENPDVWVITDTKSAEDEYYKKQFKAIKDLAAEMKCEEVLGRIIIQIYHSYMLEDVKKIYPFSNFAYTLYQEGYRGDIQEMEEYAKFCRLSGIDVIVMNEEYYSDEILNICNRYGIQLMVHTVNGTEEINEYLQNGIGVYTDRVDMVENGL